MCYFLKMNQIKKSQFIKSNLLPSLIFLHFSRIQKSSSCFIHGVSNILTQYILMHMIIHKYKLILHTYIICKYNFVNILLTGALISSNKHDISHHIGAKICKREHFLDNEYFSIYVLGYSASCKLMDLVIMKIRFGYWNH
jgi:hypothetical protein